MSDFEKAVNRVQNWAKAKGIYSGKLSALSQLLGVKAEALEYWEAIIKNKSLEEIKKEYGDIWVFLINYAYLEDYEIEPQVLDYESYDFQDLEEDINYVLKWDIGIWEIEVLVTDIYDLGAYKGLDVAECINLAMDKNEKRSHTMKDGKLVKNEDLACLAESYREAIQSKMADEDMWIEWIGEYPPYTVGIPPSSYKVQRIEDIKEILFKDGSKVTMNIGSRVVEVLPPGAYTK